MHSVDAARELDTHREPLRRLAAALLGDAHGAEDVVQDAFASVLARGERPAGLASWLRAVVRRLALDRKRRAARREAREGVAARPEAVDETGSLERLELVELLAHEVRALDEPYRAAVMLRYLDGLSPREIAGRLGVSLATIESRLVRGLESLRERLDRRGGRDRWLSAAAAWIRPAHVPWMEILLMKSAVKVGLAAAVLLLAWWGWTSSRSGTQVAGEGEALAAAPPALDQELPTTAAASDQRTAIETPPVPAAPSVPVAKLAGIVVDAKGNPLADVDVGILVDGEKDLRATPRAKSAEDGRFEIDEPQGSGSLRAIGEQWITLGAPPFGPRAMPFERVVCVVPREPLEGIVVDRDNMPVEGVRVEIGVLAATLDLPMTPSDFRSFSRAAVSARDGTYRIDDAPLLDSVSVHARKLGNSYEHHSALGGLRAQRGRILFACGGENALVLRGVVVDQREQPIQGAWVDVGAKNHKVLFPNQHFAQLRTDARGEFEVPIDPRQTDVVILAAASGKLSATLEPRGNPASASSWPSPLVIRLGRAALAIRGRVVDENGQPLPDAWVDLIDGTPWGLAKRVEGMLEPLAQFTWETLASGREWTEHVEVDEQGRFELGELAERGYRLLAFDTRSMHWKASDPIAAGASEIELVIDTSVRRQRVAGRVIDSSGAPIRGAAVKLQTNATWSTEKGMSGGMGLGSPAILSGENGEFEFRDVSPNADRLTVEAPSSKWFRVFESISKTSDVEHLEITLPRVTFVRLELSDEILKENQYINVSSADARNKTLSSDIAGEPTNLFFDANRRSAVFPIADTARFLILRGGETKTIRVPIEPELGKLNVIRQ